MMLAKVVQAHVLGARAIARHALRKSAPRIGDAVAISPHFIDGKGRPADAGRLLSTDTTMLGHAKTTYHSARSNEPTTVPSEHVRRLEEPAETNEGSATTHVVPLRLGHPETALVVHEREIKGSLETSDSGGTEVHTVHGALGPEPRAFSDRATAIAAILAHHGASITKVKDAVGHEHGDDGKFVGHGAMERLTTHEKSKLTTHDTRKLDAIDHSIKTIPAWNDVPIKIGTKVTTNLNRANGRGDLRGRVLGFVPPKGHGDEHRVVVVTAGKYGGIEHCRVSSVLPDDPTEKALTLADIMKVKDASGHEHAADGKFGTGGSKKVPPTIASSAHQNAAFDGVRAHFAKGDHAKAARELSKAAKEHPNAKVSYELGAQFRIVGDHVVAHNGSGEYSVGSATKDGSAYVATTAEGETSRHASKGAAHLALLAHAINDGKVPTRGPLDPMWHETAADLIGLDDKKSLSDDEMNAHLAHLAEMHDVPPPELKWDAFTRDDVFGDNRGNTIRLNSKAKKTPNTYETISHEFAHYLHTLRAHTREEQDRAHDHNSAHGHDFWRRYDEVKTALLREQGDKGYYT